MFLRGSTLSREVFERSHAYDACHLVGLFGRHVAASTLVAHLACALYHLVHEVVGVDHCALAALHLAFGELDHAVGEMHKVLAPLESEAVEQQRQHLEVVVLLVAHDVNHLVDGEILVAQFGGADILGHVYRGTVGAEQELVVESGVGEVGPYRAILPCGT